MNDFLYLRENNIKEIIELMLEAYTESYSDPYEILKKNSFGRAHHRLRNMRVQEGDAVHLLRKKTTSI